MAVVARNAGIAGSCVRLAGDARHQSGGIRAKRWHFAPVGTKAHSFQAQPLQGGMPAGGHQQLLSPDAGTVGQIQGDGAVVVLADPLSGRIEVHVHTVRPEPGQHQFRRILRVHAEQVTARHERHG